MSDKEVDPVDLVLLEEVQRTFSRVAAGFESPLRDMIERLIMKFDRECGKSTERLGQSNKLLEEFLSQLKEHRAADKQVLQEFAGRLDQMESRHNDQIVLITRGQRRIVLLFLLLICAGVVVWLWVAGLIEIPTEW